MKYLISLVLTFSSMLGVADNKPPVYQWTDQIGIENFTHFKPDEYGVVRQDDTPIDYGQVANEAVIKRFLPGAWSIPKYPFKGDIKQNLFERGLLTFSANGDYSANFVTAKGFAVEAKGVWYVSQDKYIKIRGVMSISIQQTSCTQTFMVPYIDNKNMVVMDESTLSFQYVKER